ncbi:MAG: hypothetical protein B6U88_01610 [Candidatus Aenigmarchaeota archaeon ex4484_56]|nr:MAG: hypothetical protein B6U88_01610 [Candidatus Aenigmarchaeota archaeon ex4484_56]
MKVYDIITVSEGVEPSEEGVYRIKGSDKGIYITSDSKRKYININPNLEKAYVVEGDGYYGIVNEELIKLDKLTKLESDLRELLPYRVVQANHYPKNNELIPFDIIKINKNKVKIIDSSTGETSMNREELAEYLYEYGVVLPFGIPI